MESFFPSLKAEALHGVRFATEQALQREIAHDVRHYKHRAARRVAWGRDHEPRVAVQTQDVIPTRVAFWGRSRETSTSHRRRSHHGST